MDIDIEFLRSIIKYDSETGIITRTDRKNGNGSYDKDGYLILKIKGKQYKSHRIAWYFHYGVSPAGVIDHINGIRDDNRISNLRDVEQSTNARDRLYKKNPITKCYGIYYDMCTNGLKRRFTIKFNGKTFRYLTLDEAIVAREKFDKESKIQRKQNEY